MCIWKEPRGSSYVQRTGWGILDKWPDPKESYRTSGGFDALQQAPGERAWLSAGSGVIRYPLRKALLSGFKRTGWQQLGVMLVACFSKRVVLGWTEKWVGLGG